MCISAGLLLAARAVATTAEPGPTTGAGPVGPVPAAQAGSLLDGRLDQGRRNDFIDATPSQNRRVIPAEQSVVPSSTPLFVWPEPPNRDPGVPWTFELSSAREPRQYFTLQTSQPALALREPLLSGQYQWTVSYTAAGGNRLSSRPRHFFLPTGASAIVFPSGSELARHVVTLLHPRMLATRKPGGTADSQSLEESRDQVVDVAAFHRWVDEARGAAIAAPDPYRPGADSPDRLARRKSNIDVRITVDREARFIEYLGVAAAVARDQRRVDQGVARLLALARWSPSGATSELSQDQANRTIYVGLARGLDLFWEHLTAAQRAAVAESIRQRIRPAVLRQQRLRTHPYDSHVTTNVWKTLEALLYVAGIDELPEAQQWLESTWDLLLSTADTWGGNDGGYGNGVGYAWYTLNAIVPSLAAIERIGGVAFTRHPWVSRFGDYFLAMTARGGTHGGAFGDDSGRTRMYANYAGDSFRLYATLTGRPEYLWYAKDAPAPRAPSSSSVWNLLLASQASQLAPPRPPDRDSWWFPDVGLAAIHDDAARSDRSSVFFRSSRYGSYNHSHADQNSFALVVRGKDVLISGGHYPHYLSAHHAAVTRATKVKNALTFDGGVGQAEIAGETPRIPRASFDTGGRIVGFADEGDWAYATGDASPAYREFDERANEWRPLLRQYLRSIAYSRAHRVLLVYDWADSEQARRWELNFASSNPFRPAAAGVAVENAPAAACIDVHGMAGAFELRSGFAVRPENGAPDHHFARFAASRPSKELSAVTVIREDCNSARVDVRVEGSRADVRVEGSRVLRFDRNLVTLTRSAAPAR